MKVPFECCCKPEWYYVVTVTIETILVLSVIAGIVYIGHRLTKENDY